MTEMRLPAIYEWPETVEEGGLSSYGDDYTDAWRQVGVYVGRVLKGEQPATLPVFQPAKFEFLVNLKTAKALRFDVPAKVLAVADPYLGELWSGAADWTPAKDRLDVFEQWTPRPYDDEDVWRFGNFLVD
mgnify:CR=1 FL=1